MSEADKGTWSISSNKVNVDTLTSGTALLPEDAVLDCVYGSVTVTSTVARAGLASCGRSRGRRARFTHGGPLPFAALTPSSSSAAKVTIVLVATVNANC